MGSCWEVIRGGDDRGELGWWEEFELFGDIGTMLGVGYTKGSTKGKVKTCWTKLTVCMEAEKKGVSSKNVTLAYMKFLLVLAEKHRYAIWRQEYSKITHLITWAESLSKPVETSCTHNQKL